MESKKQSLISVHNNHQISGLHFYSDISTQVVALSLIKNSSFAIYYEQAYPFSVSLFALLHSGKKVWIANNNTEAVAKQLIESGCLLIGDWQGREINLAIDKSTQVDLEPLVDSEAQLTIFTSGSSGQPKAITKTLRQLQCEIETLEYLWGKTLGSSQVLGTVSHQHIYGLLFRILWPLATGRCFYSEMFLSPETLINATKDVSTCWVASPAQLKRLDELTAWSDIKKMAAIFSSGGNLSMENAKQIYQQCGQKVLEIYGSSETGGIAWRQSIDNEAWKPFREIKLSQDKRVRWHLLSPYLIDSAPFILDDEIQMVDEGRFKLLGRTDRIVKVEEKRLSLNGLEQQLNNSKWVDDSHTMLFVEKRDKIAATLVLSQKGIELLTQQGRSALIKKIRKQLMSAFETVVLPRKWLFMQLLPLTNEGKIKQQLLRQLLALNLTHFPQILNCDIQNDKVELHLRMQSGLVYFSGHFPEQAVLPGVTQLAWVEKIGKIMFPIKLPFLRMEVIKFKKIIQPGEIIRMKLNWKDCSSKLYFQLDAVNDGDMHSSGRMVYGVNG